jgi:peptidylprolyl isomerase
MKNIFKNKTVAIITIVILLIAFTLYFMNMAKSIQPKSKDIKVKLETTQGDIVIQLYSDTPITSGNFEKLVQEGFYDETIFHRVIPDFMIQGGDPTGTGRGGSGYSIKDEFTHLGGNKNNRATISMANSGPNSAGSQFFINLVDNNYLDSKHAVFGEVIQGLEIVDKISEVATNPADKPLTDIRIIKATII